MKFLSKNKKSKILKESLRYKKGASENNRKLHKLLLKEQYFFCAYTKKYISELEASEIKHFNSSLKDADDYYNYYAVIRKANQNKIGKDKEYKNIKPTFFETLFFQKTKLLNKKIIYKDGWYISIDENDTEAEEFIDFLGLNDYGLFTERQRKIKRLKQTFKDANYTKKECIKHFKDFPEELSFITAIECEFDMNLSECLK